MLATNRHELADKWSRLVYFRTIEGLLGWLAHENQHANCVARSRFNRQFNELKPGARINKWPALNLHVGVARSLQVN